MMRASVLIIAAAVATATTTTACRDNPGFVFSGGGDADADETGATTDAASSGSSAGETGPVVCTPTRLSVGDACVDLPKRIPPPNLAISDIFKNDACGTPNQVYLKRTGDLLHTCNDTACNDCPLDVAVDISKATDYGMIEAVLPPEGECARVWHKSGNIDFTGLPCNTTGLAMFSVEDDDRLLFAVATSPDNPFADVDNFIFEMNGSPRTESCDGSQNKLCEDGPYALVDMRFSFGTCEIPSTVQTETWTDIVVDDRDYQLDVFAGFQCFPVGGRAYTFYLHRA